MTLHRFPSILRQRFTIERTSRMGPGHTFRESSYRLWRQQGLKCQLFGNIIDRLSDFVDDRSDFLHGDVEIVKGLDFTFK